MQVEPEFRDHPSGGGLCRHCDGRCAQSLSGRRSGPSGRSDQAAYQSAAEGRIVRGRFLPIEIDDNGPGGDHLNYTIGFTQALTKIITSIL